MKLNPCYIVGGLLVEEVGQSIRYEVVIDFLSCDERTIIKGYVYAERVFKKKTSILVHL